MAKGSVLEAWGNATFAELGAAMVELAGDDNSAYARGQIIRFCALRWDVPVLSVAAYLAMVWLANLGLLPVLRDKRVEVTCALWNLGLSLFSVWGASEGLTWTYKAVNAKGYYFTVCSDPFEFNSNSNAAMALFLFCFSKFPELGDTAFLILKGKEVRLLQWYHHSTVLLFCWLAISTEYSPGIWFATTNYVVHAVMYMYFFLMAVPGLKGFVKAVSPFVTIIQILQMVYGLFINALAIYNFAVGNYCHIQHAAVYSAVTMYGSYFVLFSMLFYESRQARSPDRRRPVVSKAPPGCEKKLRANALGADVVKAEQPQRRAVRRRTRGIDAALL